MARSFHVTETLAVRQEILWFGGIALVCIFGLWLWSSQQNAPVEDSNSSLQQQQAVSKTAPTAAPASNSRTLSKAVKATDVASVVATIPEARSFAELVKSTGVNAMLTRGGPYTIFVTSNKAFAQTPAVNITAMTAAEKKRFVEYSIVPDRKVNIDAMRSGNIPSLTREQLNIEVGPDGVARVNGASVVKTYNADNGVVYLIDRVLLPPKKSY